MRVTLEVGSCRGMVSLGLGIWKVRLREAWLLLRDSRQNTAVE